MHCTWKALAALPNYVLPTILLIIAGGNPILWDGHPCTRGKRKLVQLLESHQYRHDEGRVISCAGLSTIDLEPLHPSSSKSRARTSAHPSGSTGWATKLKILSLDGLWQGAAAARNSAPPPALGPRGMRERGS